MGHEDNCYGVDETAEQESERIRHCGVVRLVKLEALEERLEATVNYNSVLDSQSQLCILMHFLTERTIITASGFQGVFCDEAKLSGEATLSLSSFEMLSVTVLEVDSGANLLEGYIGV